MGRNAERGRGTYRQAARAPALVGAEVRRLLLFPRAQRGWEKEVRDCQRPVAQRYRRRPACEFAGRLAPSRYGRRDAARTRRRGRLRYHGLAARAPGAGQTRPRLFPLESLSAALGRAPAVPELAPRAEGAGLRRHAGELQPLHGPAVERRERDRSRARAGDSHEALLRHRGGPRIRGADAGAQRPLGRADAAGSGEFLPPGRARTRAVRGAGELRLLRRTGRRPGVRRGHAHPRDAGSGEPERADGGPGVGTARAGAARTEVGRARVSRRAVFRAAAADGGRRGIPSLRAVRCGDGHLEHRGRARAAARAGRARGVAPDGAERPGGAEHLQRSAGVRGLHEPVQPPGLSLFH